MKISLIKWYWAQRPKGRQLLNHTNHLQWSWTKSFVPSMIKSIGNALDLPAQKKQSYDNTVADRHYSWISRGSKADEFTLPNRFGSVPTFIFKLCFILALILKDCSKLGFTSASRAVVGTLGVSPRHERPLIFPLIRLLVIDPRHWFNSLLFIIQINRLVCVKHWWALDILTFLRLQ